MRENNGEDIPTESIIRSTVNPKMTVLALLTLNHRRTDLESQKLTGSIPQKPVKQFSTYQKDLFSTKCLPPSLNIRGIPVWTVVFANKPTFYPSVRARVGLTENVPHNPTPAPPSPYPSKTPSSTEHCPAGSLLGTFTLMALWYFTHTDVLTFPEVLKASEKR